MPAQPTWYRCIPEIVEQLEDPAAPPFLDRSAVEKLFCVSRRQAIRILGGAQGYQVGKTFLVTRSSLLDYLRALQQSKSVTQSLARKERLASALNEAAQHLAARRVEIRARPDPDCSPPTSIRITSPGKLEIQFQTAEELLAQIVELITAASNDFAQFRRTYEGF